MSGAVDAHNLLSQVQTPVQKHLFSSVGSNTHRTGPAQRHRQIHNPPQFLSERCCRLGSLVARSSKDESSNGQHPSDSFEQQGVGRKQFLKVLSGKRTNLELGCLLSSCIKRIVSKNIEGLSILMCLTGVQAVFWRPS